MNKYKEVELFSPEKKSQQINLNRLYTKARELILKSDNYNFHQVVDFLAEQENLDQTEAQIFILEKFYIEEGALPGQLEKAYLDLKYSPNVWAEKALAGEDFYDLVKGVNDDLRKKGIVLNNDLIKEKVDQLKQILGIGF